MRPRIVWTLIALLAAILTTTVLGSVTQTQFNLAALQSLGTPIPLSIRAATTWQDLTGFAPSLAGITAGGFVAAFVVSGLLARGLPSLRMPLHLVAGATALITAFVVMNHLFGITAVAATRSLAGLLAMGLCGAVGGWVFGRVSARARSGASSPTA
ncbi:MAG: hypothetical protein ABF271_00685 [Abyssibacter sp.]|uniref:hypothetical protein n=1 Tax=Abyssibacter sp. TaxID=2320200 RepID=UPI002EBF91DC|nr:hypothetical protein [Pseudomonadota bacterium]